MKTVPENEIKVEYTRSSGPGGQNVNKRDTKAVLHWNIGTSVSFTDTEKTTLRSFFENRLNSEDEVVLSVDSERSQARNRDTAVERLQSLAQQALIPKKKRRVTKPTRASKERRLENKRRTASKKSGRKYPDNE